MTTAPADLITLRSFIMSRTGLSAFSVGIVGDTSHAATGGYHEGKTDLINAGVYNTDYSVRLPRDRAGLTESASAMDIGYAWPHGGTKAWLAFNNALVSLLHAGDPALSAIRAVNYTPDGSRKFRTDREADWSVVNSSDTVDVHTHIEWYRDTEATASRQASIDRIDDLILHALGVQMENLTPPEQAQLHDANSIMWGFVNELEAMVVDSNSNPSAPVSVPIPIVKTIKDIQAKVAGLATPQLSDAQVAVLAQGLSDAIGTKLDDITARLDAIETRLSGAGQALQG